MKISYLIGLVLLLCFSAPTIALEDKQPVLQLLNQLKQSYSKVNSFTADMQLERYFPNYAMQNQQVWFKRPQYIKLRQLGPFKKDAELAIKPDGSIRGHLGGFLSIAVVSLDKDDENLFGVTNDSAFNTDFDKIIEIALSLSEKMTKFEITEVLADGRKQIVFDSFYNAEIDRYRMLIDVESMMLMSLERYRNKQILHKIQWKNLRLNPVIENNEFDL